MKRILRVAFSVAAMLALSPAAALADPCGMVPPIQTQQHLPIARIGVQQTYVYHHKGFESIVIRPGFKGGVSEFGMLIPFPTPPAMRKVPENIFDHIAAAVDPPEVDVYVGGFGGGFGGGGLGGLGGLGGGGGGLGVTLPKDKVKVLREEAVGMYEVAVLAAGSAKALNLWMKDHGFRYPDGMDDVCDDYVKMRWCFVAVKAKVGVKRRVNPKPGQRKVETGLPANSVFDGHVQAMAFRFRSRKLVVPMRLSAFNKGSMRNIVYLLADTPASIRGIPAQYVRRQIPGHLLYKNLTGPLPLRIHGAKAVARGRAKTAGGRWVKLSGYNKQRDPRPHNGRAADLFVADLTATASHRLALPYETKEKSLNDVAERLGLRDPSIDELNRKAYEKERKRALERNKRLLQKMTLTVIDGDFSREFIAKYNLTFRRYLMPLSLNTPRRYDAKQMGPTRNPGGMLVSGMFSADETDSRISHVSEAQEAAETAARGARWSAAAASLFVVGFAVVVFRRRRK